MGEQSPLSTIEFQLTRLMRGVTLCGRGGTNRLLSISTHTPHARRDLGLFNFFARFEEISTHTPHARRDRALWQLVKWVNNFNSHASCEA